MLKIAKQGNQYRVELFQVDRLNTLFSELVKEQLRELIKEPCADVIFNLEGIRFIDTSGFEVLMEITEGAKLAGSQFKLCNVSDDVKELVILLELEGKFSFVNCENTREKILMVLD